MKRISILFSILLLSACLFQPVVEPTPTADIPLLLKQEENPYAPQVEDLSKQQAGVILTSLNLSERSDLNPIRAELNILGSMPSVCNELRVKFNPPDETYKVDIEIYSLVNPNVNCDNVFQQFKTTILLGLYSQGQYTVWVNDAYVGDFTSY
ncbi:MAG: hypothetical protein HOP27_07120 [Anaerolineales bacterium]|nr:hypothetical protein [Anaerolineales bacterium]